MSNTGKKMCLLGFLAAAGFAVSLGCSARMASGGTDSNTHWLDVCTSDAECGDLKCYCGVCTRPCAASDSCAALGTNAICEAQPFSCDVGKSVCLASCETSRDCPAGLRCEGGQCTAKPAGTVSPEPDAGSPPGPAPSICELPLSSGDCMGHSIRYGYSPEAGACVRFTYGLCGGNENNFPTFEACHTVCGAVTEGPCAPMDARPGSVICVGVTGFIWNVVTCEPLECGCIGADCDRIYPTATECLVARAACNPAAPSLCDLPLSSGNCDGLSMRYGYSPEAGTCVQFTYGLCGGNENNFSTVEACRAVCAR